MMLMMMMSFKIHREMKRNGLAPLKIIRLKYSMRQWWDNQPQTKNKKRQQKIFFFFFFFTTGYCHPPSPCTFCLLLPPFLEFFFFPTLDTRFYNKFKKTKQRRKNCIQSNQLESIAITWIILFKFICLSSSNVALDSYSHTHTLPFPCFNQTKGNGKKISNVHEKKK